MVIQIGSNLDPNRIHIDIFDLQIHRHQHETHDVQP